MNIDPVAAAGAGGADLQAQIDAELAQLAADAEALRGMLVEDAVVTARVLPSNGLTDLLEIAGRRVAASLPPNVRPGDVLQVRVEGFVGEQIQVQIVAYGPPAATASVPPAIVPATPAPAFVEPAVVPTAGTPVTTPATAGTPATAESGATTIPDIAIVTPARGFGPAVVGASGPSAGPARANVPAGTPNSIEARLAAARATISPPAPGPASTATPAGETPGATRSVPAGQRFVAPPQITAKAPVAVPAAAVPRATGLAAYTEPVALLRSLRLPVTPSSVASAALALERPHQLPAALAALERALPRASDNPHVATLKTLAAFVGNIDPRSPALATQIAAYVEHVVDGAEPKLATLLAATRAAEPVPLPAAGAAQTGAPASGAAAQPAPAGSAQPSGAHSSGAQRSDAHAPLPAPHAPIAAAVVAERSAALGADLKQTLLALAADPATQQSLVPALSNALTAITAVQLNAAQALAANPDGIAFTIPLTTQYGSANAHISVKRDAPQGGGARLDGENFRIAFVLDTAHYGTVAIELVTVGREVTVDVRAESGPAMRAFRDALGTLTARLESLRYRVASAGATVGTTSTISVEAPPSSPHDPDAAVDSSA